MRIFMRVLEQVAQRGCEIYVLEVCRTQVVKALSPGLISQVTVL